MRCMPSSHAWHRLLALAHQYDQLYRNQHAQTLGPRGIARESLDHMWHGVSGSLGVWSIQRECSAAMALKVIADGGPLPQRQLVNRRVPLDDLGPELRSHMRMKKRNFEGVYSSHSLRGYCLPLRLTLTTMNIASRPTTGRATIGNSGTIASSVTSV